MFRTNGQSRSPLQQEGSVTKTSSLLVSIPQVVAIRQFNRYRLHPLMIQYVYDRRTINSLSKCRLRRIKGDFVGRGFRSHLVSFFLDLREHRAAPAFIRFQDTMAFDLDAQYYCFVLRLHTG